ncbi:MAG: DUF4164 family protein [Hyphomicrobiales bacterium]
MSGSDLLQEATARLLTALEGFETSVAQRRQETLSAEALQEQVDTLSVSLREERTRSSNLVAANDEVAERLEAVIAAVQEILKRQ